MAFWILNEQVFFLLKKKTHAMVHDAPKTFFVLSSTFFVSWQNLKSFWTFKKKKKEHWRLIDQNWDLIYLTFAELKCKMQFFFLQVSFFLLE